VPHEWLLSDDVISVDQRQSGRAVVGEVVFGGGFQREQGRIRKGVCKVPGN